MDRSSLRLVKICFRFMLKILQHIIKESFPYPSSRIISFFVYIFYPIHPPVPILTPLHSHPPFLCSWHSTFAQTTNCHYRNQRRSSQWYLYRSKQCNHQNYQQQGEQEHQHDQEGVQTYTKTSNGWEFTHYTHTHTRPILNHLCSSSSNIYYRKYSALYQ